MIAALLMVGVLVLLLNLFITPVGTSNALLISAVLFGSAIVLSLVKAKKLNK
ncbi:hypothetical protein LF817_17140 [Halobacillus sp. A1]|uniref:hypothetical protein n=1 Tax=Halobacillus sp. A1 TaxID=2880262 RepID=UPI0020A68790|nr:hypothetical protein [Halobacillus sp. A1]MCP3033052.1 hypothetical protein [Halobacillus sp. A1]